MKNKNCVQKESQSTVSEESNRETITTQLRSWYHQAPPHNSTSIALIFPNNSMPTISLFTQPSTVHSFVPHLYHDLEIR